MGHDGNFFHLFLFILMIFGFIFFFVGVFGNAAVVIYNVCLNHERTLSSWLITNLALADLLVCLTIYPKAIVRYFLRAEKYDEIFHKLGHCVLHVSAFLSTTMLLSITVDKYVFIEKPLRYPLIVTSRRIKAVLCAIWLTAAVQLLAMYFYSKGKSYGVRPNSVNLFPLSTIVMLSVLIVIIAVLNYKMLKIVQQQRKWMALDNVVHSKQDRPVEIQHDQDEHEQMHPKNNAGSLRRLVKQIKAIKTFAIIFGVLTVCFVPYFVVTIVQSTCLICFTSNITYTAHLECFAMEVVGINSIANAFIYALKHREYLKAYKKLFSSLWKR